MTDESRYLLWLKKGLSKPGKTQKGLARALGIDPMGVSRLVNGKRKLQIGELQKMSVYIGEQLPDFGRTIAATPAHISRGVMGRIGPAIWQDGPADLGEVPGFEDRRFPIEKQRSYIIDSSIPGYGISRGAYILAVPFAEYAHYATPTSLCVIERTQGSLKNFTIGQAGEKPAAGVLDLVIFVGRALI